MKKLTAILATLILVVLVSLSFTNTAQSEEALDGKEVYLDKKCQQCHAIESEEIEATIKDKYPDLSVLSDTFELDFLKDYLLKKEKINNKNHLMKFNGSDEELTAIALWLLDIHEKNSAE